MKFLYLPLFACLIAWPLMASATEGGGSEAPPRRLRFGAGIYERLADGTRRGFHPIDAVFEMREMPTTANPAPEWHRLPTHAFQFVSSTNPHADLWDFQRTPEIPAEILPAGRYQYRLTLPLTQVRPFLNLLYPPRVCFGIESSLPNGRWEGLTLLGPPQGSRGVHQPRWCTDIRMVSETSREPVFEDFYIYPYGRIIGPTPTIRIEGEILQNPDTRYRPRYSFLRGPRSESTIVEPGEVTIVAPE